MSDLEACPGYLTWSAFGANYPDSVCSSVLTWDDPADHPGNGVLCDADDDCRPKDVPCPFCQPLGFTEYLIGGGYTVPLCSIDEGRLPDFTPIHYHDGVALKWTAECPEHGEQPVLMRDYSDVENFDDSDFVEWLIAVPVPDEENHK